MDVHVLEKIWKNGGEGSVFTPTIRGWTVDPKTHKRKAKAFKENKARTPDAAARALASIDVLGSQTDCYFCPVKFKGVTRAIDDAVDSLAVLWADLDDADPLTVPVKPTIAWRTSETHCQGVWLLTVAQPTSKIEQLNKAMTYACGADKSGWDLTQLLRVPGSYNFKYGEPQECTLLWDDGEIYAVETIEAALTHVFSSAEKSPRAHASPLEELLEGWKISKRARDLIFATEAPLGERSDRLWELEKLLVEANVPVTRIVSIIKLTVWNKFADRKNEDKQLLSETLKAEAEYKSTHAKIAAVTPDDCDDELGAVALDDFLAEDIEDPSWLVQGFVQTASVGVCAGEPKTMKSTMMLDMAVAVASGKLFLGKYPVKQVPVLYIQEENGKADIKRRFMRISNHHRVFLHTSMGYETQPTHLHITNNTGLNLMDEAGRRKLEATIVHKGIKFLILDPWYMMAGDDIDENSAKDVSPVLKYLTSIRNKYDCAVMLVHHFKKGEASRGGQRMRGSSVFHAWVECGLYVELNKGIAGNILLEREFRAFPSAGNSELNIVFDADTARYSVQVYDRATTYDKPSEKLKPEAVGVKPPDPEIIDLMADGDDDLLPVVRGELDMHKLLKIIRAGTFNLTRLGADYSLSKYNIYNMLKTLEATGDIKLTVPITEVKTSSHIKLVRRAADA